MGKILSLPPDDTIYCLLTSTVYGVRHLVPHATHHCIRLAGPLCGAWPSVSQVGGIIFYLFRYFAFLKIAKFLVV